MTEGYKIPNPTAPGDEPAKKMRAEKKGATIGPTLGSLHGGMRSH